MSKVLNDVRYADSHEWVKIEGEIYEVYVLWVYRQQGN